MFQATKKEVLRSAKMKKRSIIPVILLLVIGLIVGVKRHHD
ncbi:hypothetical protein ISR11_0238 [Streptococcus pyogenes]|nr:hypothetical protein HMPREF1225_0313 [Streptococcus pyogenes UTSW-2]EQL80970.1 hypothetical protein HMPREF1226_1683 [Streptococcus pyogenes UTMEM-1]ESA56303.1 hypothetical protein HMPREF1238_1252 [Streptococcus pyogenes GA40377]SDV80580.1 hypothetical protein ISR11_0238 [Streptococcus pyogenes]SDV89776.1 hypothetical protein ISR9_1232 [Streptococcus pyogenes]